MLRLHEVLSLVAVCQRVPSQGKQGRPGKGFPSGQSASHRDTKVLGDWYFAAFRKMCDRGVADMKPVEAITDSLAKFI